MFNFRFIALILLVLGCENPVNYRLENVTQLSYEGDNGEAYFNADDSKVVFQSKRNNNECDKLYIVDIDGKNFTEFPLNDGAFTCAYFSLNDKYIFFSSTLINKLKSPLLFLPKNIGKYESR